MNLDMTKFGELNRCLTIFKDLCNDVEIREGIIRQKTNDGAVVFEIDLTPLLGDLNIRFSNLKEKLDLFKVFYNQAVTIENDGENTNFVGTYSTYVFKNPDLDFMDNKFITAEDLQNATQMNRDDLMLSTSIIPTITEAIKIITQGFHVNSIKVAFDGNEASITSTTVAKDQWTSFISNIRTEQEIVCSTNLVSTPFIIDHDGDILFEMFKNSGDRVLTRLSTTISDININLYSRGQLIFEEVK